MNRDCLLCGDEHDTLTCPIDHCATCARMIPFCDCPEPDAMRAVEWVPLHATGEAAYHRRSAEASRELGDQEAASHADDHAERWQALAAQVPT